MDFLLVLIPTPLVLALLQQHSYFFVHFKNVYHSCICYFCAM